MEQINEEGSKNAGFHVEKIVDKYSYLNRSIKGIQLFQRGSKHR